MNIIMATVRLYRRDRIKAKLVSHLKENIAYKMHLDSLLINTVTSIRISFPTYILSFHEEHCYVADLSSLSVQAECMSFHDSF